MSDKFELDDFTHTGAGHHEDCLVTQCAIRNKISDIESQNLRRYKHLLFCQIVIVVFAMILLVIVGMYLSDTLERNKDLEASIQSIKTNVSKLRSGKIQTKIGPQGEKGIKGDKGFNGENGLNGQKGQPGRRGLPGETGLKGERGLQGVIGIVGSKGEQGEKGSNGDQGAVGRKGIPGDKGLPGNIGQIGEKGKKGDEGQDGLQGSPGLNGLVGDKGQTGEKGPVGTKGQKGDKGLRGDKGSYGEKGQSGKRGDNGKVGDKGKQGEIGPKGLIGDKGPIGLRGPVGSKGLPGVKGAKGEKATITCGASWLYFRGSCYIFEKKLRMNWHNAQNNCRRMGGNLVKIEDFIEQYFLRAFMKELDMGPAYIGLHDTDQEGKFIWADGSPLTFSDWNSGEPNDSERREDCVHFHNEANYRWNDIACSSTFGYVCEKLP